nr:MAG TPA: hypothetical protein [Bacteriophage sp.]
MVGLAIRTRTGLDYMMSQPLDEIKKIIECLKEG